MECNGFIFGGGRLPRILTLTLLWSNLDCMTPREGNGIAEQGKPNVSGAFQLCLTTPCG